MFLYRTLIVLLIRCVAFVLRRSWSVSLGVIIVTLFGYLFYYSRSAVTWCNL